MATFVVPELTITQKVRDNIGAEFSRRIVQARTDRDQRMKQIWAMALTTYEGKAPPMDWPWKNASNAVVPLIPAHVDAWASRLRNAGTAQDPTYLTSAWSKTEFVGGLTASDYAEIWQQYSKWLEKEEIDNDAFMEKVSTITTKYGDAFAYIPWEHDLYMDITFDENGTPVKEIKDLLNKPVVHVIHPKNWYMPISEEDPQISEWCGFDEDFTEDQIRLKIEFGEWNKKNGEKLLEFLKVKTKKALKKAGGPKDADYFRRTEAGNLVNQAEWDFQNEKRKSLEMPQVEDSTKVSLVHCFARIDTDGDGIPEEVDMLLHPESKIVVAIYWNRYAHKKRPVVPFSFLWREGTWMNIGVPEMLFNANRIMNEIMRDMLNNNKVANTKMFLARAGGVVDDDEPMFPGRIIFAEDIEADFKAVDLGSGKPGTSLNDMAIIQAWAERRDGMTDFNLGREKTSRTPATTMLALLEEGNERVVSIISRQKKSQAEVWTQVHQLYAQRGDAEGLDRVIGEEDAAKMRMVWAEMTVDDIRKKLVLNAQVSTQNLNRSVKRQEMAALLGQLDAFHTRLINLAQAMRSTDDPILRQLFGSMAKSGQFLMKRILNTSDIKEQEDMNPDLAGMIAEIPAGEAFQDGTNQTSNEPRGQVDQAKAVFENQGAAGGPTNAPGRPAAGFPRTDGGGGQQTAG